MRESGVGDGDRVLPRAQPGACRRDASRRSPRPAAEPAALSQSADADNAAPTPDPRPPNLDTTRTIPRRRRQAPRRLHRTRSRRSTAADQVELLTFVIAGEQYAVSIEHIVEIVTPRAGHAHSECRSRRSSGSCRCAGRSSPSSTSASKLRPSAAAPEAATRASSSSSVDGETLGFEVDRVLRVVKIGPRRRRAAPRRPRQRAERSHPRRLPPRECVDDPPRFGQATRPDLRSWNSPASNVARDFARRSPSR